MLQTRVGKRTGRAALKMAVDMVSETGHPADQGRGGPAGDRGPPGGGPPPPVLRRQLAGVRPGSGRLAGAAVGRAYFSADDAAAAAGRGEPVVLVRTETSPEDVHGMLAAEGVLTARGGLVSHAAVVARGWGKPAVVGAESLRIGTHHVTAGGVTVSEREWLSVDGTSRHRGGGRGPPHPGRPPRRVRGAPRLGRRDQGRAPRGAGQRRHRGRRRQRPAVGRRGDRAVPDRAHVLGGGPAPGGAAHDPGRQSRRRAARRSSSSGGSQRADFVEILAAMDGLPVTVRLLDPPLHEFLPSTHELAVKRGDERLRRRGAAALRRRPGVAGGEPDARDPRRAARRDQAGALRHAGASPDGGGPTAGGRRAVTR